MTATWTPEHDVAVTWTDLPDAWTDALHRLGSDLHVRQYNGVIEEIGWVAEYDPECGRVHLLSDVTVRGRGPDGLGMSGACPLFDDPEETILACIADLVQDQVARAHIAWPWRDTGGFMTAELIDTVAIWTDQGRSIPIGTLRRDRSARERSR